MLFTRGMLSARNMALVAACMRTTAAWCIRVYRPDPLLQAGVTFLAFGNGSPDVFSTFGAMKTGSGSLAIGELIGAASFIVSVISGSMMLIAPFHVKAYPFLRDVGFFTVAVAMTLAFLFDGHLRFAECLSLVALYVCYATTVIIGSWVQERRRRRRMAIAAARGEYTNSRAGSPYQDEPSLGDVERASTQGGLLAVPGAAGNSPYLSPVSPSEYDPDVNPIDIWADQAGRPISSPPSPRLGAVSPATTPSGGRASLVRSQTRFRSGVVARHSLLGAVEFRDVVRSLQLESTADRSAEVFAARDPERFLPHPAHAHGRPRHTHKRGVSVGAGPMSALEPSASAQSFSAPGRNRSNSTGASSKPKLARSHSAVPDLGGDDATSGGWSSLTVRQAPRGREAVPAPVDDPWREHGPGDACDDELLLPPSTMPLGADATRTVPALSRLDTRLAPPASVGDSSSRNHSPVPSIHISAANPEDDDFKARRRASVSSLAKPSRTQRALELHREFTRPLRRALFPSLRHFKDKSWLGLFVSVVTAPALLLLNLTLPIVDDDAEARAIAMPEQLPGGAVRLEGEERLLTAHAEVSSEEEAEGPIVQLGPSTPDSDPWAARDRQHNAQRDLGVAAALRHLPSSDSLSVHTMTLDEPAAPGQQAEQCDDCASVDSHSAPATGAPLLQSVAQCAFSPPFVVWALTDPHESGSGWKVLVALLAGLVLGALVLAAGLRARARGGAWYSHKATLAAGMARCSLGFLVSVMWIMTIVDEVVSILQTIGLICGLSDAILGLTVFAMGNSLGDLVANVTIARMGHPVMAVSLCALPRQASADPWPDLGVLRGPAAKPAARHRHLGHVPALRLVDVAHPAGRRRRVPHRLFAHAPRLRARPAAHPPRHARRRAHERLSAVARPRLHAHRHVRRHHVHEQCVFWSVPCLPAAEIPAQFSSRSSTCASPEADACRMLPAGLLRMSYLLYNTPARCNHKASLDRGRCEGDTSLAGGCYRCVRVQGAVLVMCRYRERRITRRRCRRRPPASRRPAMPPPTRPRTEAPARRRDCPTSWCRRRGCRRASVA
jgi:sodium/potassium/calcium exchanger 6